MKNKTLKICLVIDGEVSEEKNKDLGGIITKHKPLIPFYIKTKNSYYISYEYTKEDAIKTAKKLFNNRFSDVRIATNDEIVELGKIILDSIDYDC